MIDTLTLIWYEFASRVLIIVLGVIFILLGIISPDLAYDAMTKAMDNDKNS